MKEIQKMAAGKNFSAVSVVRMNDLKDYRLPFGPDVVINGKVFVGQALGCTGAEISYQYLAPGEDCGVLHTHKTHEELYLIVKGEGEYQVGGEIFPIAEGSIVRVAPEGRRALRNNGTEPMVMVCIQYKANSFAEQDAPSADGVMLNEPLKW